MPDKQLSKILAIVGPTSSGKTRLGIKLARQFNGEIISADSRAIYQEMNLGTAKPSAEEQQGVAHHLLDFVPIEQEYTLADYQKDAFAAIDDILGRGKLPIIVGGTGLYVDAVIYNFVLPKTVTNPALRQKLEGKSATQLFEMLKNIDPETAGQIDQHNPRRIIRALEVKLGSGASIKSQQQKGAALYSTLALGLNPPKEELYERIELRLQDQLNLGLENQVRA